MTDAANDSDVFRPAATYALTRYALLRGLGFIYAVAFLVATLQVVPLVGHDGLLPAAPFLERVAATFDSRASAFFALPGVFWITASDAALVAVSVVGLAVALAVVAGFANAPMMFVLWLIQLSLCGVGQPFWGYGWETLLLEAGFLGIFLAPVLDPRPGARSAVPRVVVFLFRWVLFRLMFGAGLIKVRGDPCWLELTCLRFHYETQPLPNPLSWLLHHAPPWFHTGGALFNHFAELIVPWGVFGPHRVRHAAGVVLMAFQIMLILSGNLSFLNWLTLVVCLSCFDDGALGRALPALKRRLAGVAALRTERPRRVATIALAIVVGVLSVNPVLNLLSPRQAMNASFDPLHLVNTYGAFGSVGRQRFEVIIEGTRSAAPKAADWREYEFECKPGDPLRIPCVIAPYQPRLDWQIWFAAFRGYRSAPWVVHLAYQLLEASPGPLGLLAHDPFAGKPPRYVRAELYRYWFTDWGEPGFWHRERVASYLPPVSLDDPGLRRFLEMRGWDVHESRPPPGFYPDPATKSPDRR